MNNLKHMLPNSMQQFLFAPSDNIIRNQNEAKNSLIIGIIIMSFLCSLALCSANLLHQTAARWNQQIASESTIEIIPDPTRDIANDLNLASNLAMGFDGVYDAQILSDGATRALLEPWLGKDFNMNALPLPRLIIIHFTDNSKFNSEKFSTTLRKYIPNSRFNSHRKWIKELTILANSNIIVTAFIVCLLVISLIITIIFATNSAISANQDIINILHFMGAESGYIIRQFELDFLQKAVKGAALGSSATIILFFIFFIAAPYYTTSGSNIALSAFFNNFRLNAFCYLQIIMLIITVSSLTIITSRFTIKHKLKLLDMVG